MVNFRNELLKLRELPGRQSGIDTRGKLCCPYLMSKSLIARFELDRDSFSRGGQNHMAILKAV